jgi:hypothetical protein
MAATNRERLQAVVQRNVTDQGFTQEFCHFHLSVVQKLWPVDYFNGQIAKLKPEMLYKQRTHDDKLVVDQYPDTEEFGLYANLLLDGILMNAMSTLDTLAHEIRMLYRFNQVPHNIYISTIKDCLTRDHAHCALTVYLASELAKPWFDTFATYRHCTTHESLVGPNIRFEISAITKDLQLASLPLPDNPRCRPFTYKRGRELKSYCNRIRKDITLLVRHAYYCIINDIKRVHNAVPIP